MSSQAHGDPRSSTPHLPNEVLYTIGEALAVLGYSKTTLSMMMASRDFYDIFSNTLQCAKLTLDKTNCHSKLKGLSKAGLVDQRAEKRHSTWAHIANRRRLHTTHRVAPYTYSSTPSIPKPSSGHRIMPLQSSMSKRLQHYSRLFSHCRHLTISDMESAQAVIRSYHTARSVGHEGLWSKVDTLCLGPKLLWRLGYLDETAIATVNALTQLNFLWPLEVCFTVDIIDGFDDFHVRLHRDNGLSDDEHGLCSGIESLWDFECRQSTNQVIENFIKHWDPVSVSIHNISIQQLPFIGAPCLRIFWAVPPALRPTTTKENPQPGTLDDEYNVRVRDVARMTSHLSDEGELVEFCGHACFGCDKRDHRACSTDFKTHVRREVNSENRNAFERSVKFVWDPPPCTACKRP